MYFAKVKVVLEAKLHFIFYSIFFFGGGGALKVFTFYCEPFIFANSSTFYSS